MVGYASGPGTFRRTSFNEQYIRGAAKRILLPLDRSRQTVLQSQSLCQAKLSSTCYV